MVYLAHKHKKPRAEARGKNLKSPGLSPWAFGDRMKNHIKTEKPLAGLYLFKHFGVTGINVNIGTGKVLINSS